ncbi:telomere length regulation protein-domain-containing protein [Stachybotrys elegans]|uniref:Telomere length regulation protein-domain-containing protein n=1 Tax=Stachybotrys elegans TaxID=80388 RepID=A0A8K0T287_9HYPO|nr:telomere length regulation protein-domain-containing protein [Stachybotrys elegans]
MDELLTPVSTTYLKPKKDDGHAFLTEVTSTRQPTQTHEKSSISTAQDVVEVLGQQPDYDSLIGVLRFLNQESGGFSIHTPGPQSAAIVHLLVTEIASNYWTLLLEGSEEGGNDTPGQSEDARLFVQCLQNIAGLNALLAHIKALSQELGHGKESSRRPDLPLILGLFLDLLAAVLGGNTTIQTLWTNCTGRLPNPQGAKVQTQALISLLGGGKVVSIAAEAATTLPRQPETRWVADGAEYSKWLGRNISSWMSTASPVNDNGTQFCHDLLQRGMSLGYAESLTTVVIEELLLSKNTDSQAFNKLCFHQSHISKKIMHFLLDLMARKFLNNLILDDNAPDPTVSAVAGVLRKVIEGDEARTNILIAWCTSSSGAGLGAGVGIRRAVLAALASNTAAITSVLEKSLAQFGDELYIRHAAILQQEVHAQILLLSAGYVHRLSPLKLRMLIRSGAYLGTISNRIAASQTRGRVLGMIIGESLSALVDAGEKRLDFKMEELQTDNAQWMRGLIKVSDSIGPVDTLLSDTPVTSTTSKPTPKQAKPKPKRKPKAQTPMSTMKPRPIIEEIDSDDDDDDDDLVPYAKNSDPEDSDDDATLVQRNKLKAPVYVRDLIAFLRDSESYDKQKLGLQTAPLLIRRKASFGTEVSSHAEELAGLLVGIQDKFEIDKFDDLKLQSMIALVVAQPKSMAPWFARTFFEGDYSLTQRTTVLVSLGLSARELAGFETSEYQASAAFPSKQLPEKMEQLYLKPQKQDSDNRLAPSQLKALPPTALDTIAASLTSSFLGPLAAKAADANSGPDVLKLQSFTARYKSTQLGKPRVRAIPNTTAALLASHFFYPLTAHFQVALRASRPLVLNPGLLTLYLQTLGIIIHAAGPSTLSLPQLTSELWDLLLAVRVHVVNELSAMRGWLVAMASLLEVNEGDLRRLCEAQGRQVMETREWVGSVFERTRGEDGGEENDVKMLAAGVLIKLGEVIEKYQALLMGEMLNF